MDTLSRRLDSSRAINLQTEVRMHPLVLLSAVDHYNRLNNAITSGKRVVGILLGTQTERFIDINNSYAVPFEEDESNKNVWFLDGNYLDEMFLMFKKVWSRANIVGWYSSGPKIAACDLAIHRMIRRYCANPVYCIIDVSPEVQGIPATCYIARESESRNSEGEKYCFYHLRTVIDSIEAESIGVDQLLRDLTTSTTQTMETKIEDKKFSLQKFNESLKVIKNYLEVIQQKHVEGDQNILRKVQKILWIATSIQQFKNSASLKRNHNDSAIVRYVTSLMKSFMDVVDLIDRKEEGERNASSRTQPSQI
ncbi:26S proteasome non-ATPase regulatory subunit 7 [Perkinsela sp. CCAP 1560/4]|nr:26S proteasome non-ATPase regulatory subunit 7 [Perkinsela sp. CCAP 1560/4]|eukprot:KNH08991.1 26S proteasome non-ATPase regulatory subunit 7 [Perkinsela sp. CCAP 1560/4]